jgi:hypothetical protein
MAMTEFKGQEKYKEDSAALVPNNTMADEWDFGFSIKYRFVSCPKMY